MADYKWPEAEKRTHLGKPISRIDGADKVSGRAKYTYDLNRPGMLYGKVVRSKYAHTASSDSVGTRTTSARSTARPARPIAW